MISHFKSLYSCIVATYHRISRNILSVLKDLVHIWAETLGYTPASQLVYVLCISFGTHWVHLTIRRLFSYKVLHHRLNLTSLIKCVSRLLLNPFLYFLVVCLSLNIASQVNIKYRYSQFWIGEVLNNIHELLFVKLNIG